MLIRTSVSFSPCPYARGENGFLELGRFVLIFGEEYKL
jgi:hypothetical protein